MAEDNDLGNKVYDPTPHKREEEKKKGNVPKARDAAAIAKTGAALAVLLASGGAIGRTFDTLFTRSLGDLGALTRGDGARVMHSMAMALAVLTGPVLLASIVASTAINIAQSGFRFDLSFVNFNFEKLNPLPGLKNFFSFKDKAKEIVISILRIGVMGGVAYRALVDDVPKLLVLTTVPVREALPAVASALVHMVLAALVALLIIAVIDYGQSWFKIEKEMMMTRQELQDESKSSEGDSKAKGKMKARGRNMIKQMSLGEVKNASVVVTNPTHVAVALRYDDADAAPVVLAKGHDEFALRIRAEARHHGIPIVESRVLARALDADVPIGATISAAHFAAVARVLAFVYRLRQRDGLAPRPTSTPSPSKSSARQMPEG